MSKQLGPKHLVVAVIGALTGWTFIIHLTRSRADFVMQWPATAISGAFLKEMGTQGEKGLQQLRIIAAKGSPFVSAKAAAILAEHGQANTDFPILLDVLQRARQPNIGGRAGDEWELAMIEDALRKLSGLDLPKGSSPQEWEKKWRDRLQATP